MSPMTSQPLTIEYALLGFLRQRPMYGYEIYQQLSAATGPGLVWRLKQSRLYAWLGRLEQEAYVTTRLEPQAARPPRKIFELTEAGREAFLAWVQAPVGQGRRLRLEFMVKLYFSQRESPAVTRKLIDRQRVACRSWLAQQQQQVDSLPPSQLYERLVYEFRIGQLQAMLDWLDTCQQSLVGGVE